MIFSMLGSGGAALNFNLVWNPKPETCAENTVWIDTDVPVTGWAFSNAMPDVVPDGMLLIDVGTSSPAAFNALRGNCIMVYPRSAKQKVNGELVRRTAMTYLDGAWVEWTPTGALYYFGDECAEESGGWNARGWGISSDYKDEVVPVAENKEDHMQITMPSTGMAGGAVEVMLDQDLTGIESLTIDFELVTNSYKVQLAVIDRNQKYLSDPVCAEVLVEGSSMTVTRRTAALDVSGLSGLYDVAITFSDHWAGGSSCTMKVYSVMKNETA